MSSPAGLPRFFVPPEAEGPAAAPSLVAGDEVVLPQTESHHATHVLRLREGAAVELFDGRGGCATGRVARIRKGEVLVTVEAVRPAAHRPRPEVHLAFAVPKGSRLDWLLEKATELGAASLRPVRFERSVAGGEDLADAKRRRWLGHCIAAAKQAGTDWLPDLLEPLPLAAFLDTPDPGGLRLFGDLSAEAAPLRQILPAGCNAETIQIVIGPEGGLTDAERLALRAAGFSAARLGRTTLRIETAAVALIAAVLAGCDPASSPSPQGGRGPG